MQGERCRTGLFTGMAGNTLLRVPVNLYEAELIKPAINCPQRAQVLTEGPVNFQGQRRKEQQHPQFPKK